MRDWPYWVGVMAALVAVSGCGAPARQSTWVAQDMTVDAELGEWRGHLDVFEDAGVDLGVFNDDRNLYVSIAAATRDVQRQIETRGLIVWLDASGKKHKTLGIRYPLGLQTVDLRGLDGAQTWSREGPRGERGEPTPEQRERLKELFESSLGELEILTGDDGAEHGRRLEVADAAGIQVAVHATAASLIYELRIPLGKASADTVALPAKPGAKIAIGIETPRIDREALRERFGEHGGPGRGEPGGGRPPMGGAAWGGGHGMPGGRPGPPPSIDAWTTVRLADLGKESRT